MQYLLYTTSCCQEKSNKDDIEGGDDEEGKQAVHGEVELDRGDPRDQVSGHLEEVWESCLVRQLEEESEVIIHHSLFLLRHQKATSVININIKPIIIMSTRVYNMVLTCVI